MLDRREDESVQVVGTGKPILCPTCRRALQGCDLASVNRVSTKVELAAAVDVVHGCPHQIVLGQGDLGYQAVEARRVGLARLDLDGALCGMRQVEEPPADIRPAAAELLHKGVAIAADRDRGDCRCLVRVTVDEGWRGFARCVLVQIGGAYRGARRASGPKYLAPVGGHVQQRRRERLRDLVSHQCLRRRGRNSRRRGGGRCGWVRRCGKDCLAGRGAGPRPA